MKKYTKDNGEVQIIRELEDGYLVKKLLCEGYDYEEDGFDSEELLSDETFFFTKEELFDEPVTERVAGEVAILLSQKSKLEEEIHQLRDAKRIQEAAQGKIKDWPFLQSVLDYLNGDFTHILYMDTLQVLEKPTVYNTPYICVVNSKDRGWKLFRMRNENYHSSSDDKQVRVFKSLEEVATFSKQHLIDRINKWDEAYWNCDGQFKDWFDGLHHSNSAKKDPEVLEAYKAKYDELKQAENKKRQAHLEKEIADLEAKKKRLAELSAQ